MTDKFKKLVKRKTERLNEYKKQPGAKQTIINAMVEEIKILVGYFNANQSWIYKLQEEANEALKYKMENDSLKKRLQFYHESTILDGKEQSVYFVDLNDIKNNIKTTPYGFSGN